MWFMNRIANPIVRFILRSRLHGLMSTALLLITYRGRKSGKEYTLPVQYARDGNVLIVVPGMPEQKTWWRNLKDGMPVQVTLHGKTLGGIAVLLKQETDMEAMIKGFTVYLQRFPSLARVHKVRTEAVGAYNADDVRAAAAAVIMVRVELN